MKKFTQTTLIALSLSINGFSQTVKEPVKNPTGGTTVNQSINSRLILLSPTDGKLFNGSESSKPVLFRWTAIVPKPKEAVTYRLKVWQLMQGQSASEAMRSNQPIATKDVVNITQAAISNLYTGPCRPPYLCDFVWAIEVINSDEIATGKIYAASQQYSFKFNVAADVPVGLVTADNKSSVGSTGMSGGKSLNTQEDPIPVVNINGLPPGQPVIIGGGTKVQEDPIHGVDVKLGVNSKTQGDGVHGVVVKRGIKASKN
jgi:hypothetical protein